jgi:hypothetical protein
VVLSQEEPLVLRYRLVVHRGDSKQVNIERLQKEYSSE